MGSRGQRHSHKNEAGADHIVICPRLFCRRMSRPEMPSRCWRSPEERGYGSARMSLSMVLRNLRHDKKAVTGAVKRNAAQMVVNPHSPPVR